MALSTMRELSVEAQEWGLRVSDPVSKLLDKFGEGLSEERRGACTKIADILEDEGMTVGAELGVLKGDFARDLLERWPSCKKYVLVDLWQQQENYVDLNNFPQKRQDLNLKL